MPRYGYVCPRCCYALDVIKPMAEFDTIETCSHCGHFMNRDFNQHGVHCGNKNYGNGYIVSEAMGIHPSQTEEHRQAHPDIEVMPMGQLKFTDFKSHDAYLNKMGWGKNEQRRIRKRVSR